MKFLVDNQLPGALARFLATHGHDAQHVVDLKLDEANDREIWRYAVAQNRVLISKDEDFLHLVNQIAASGSLIWVRLGNCRKRVLIEAFERALPSIITSLDQGQRFIELR